MSKQIASLIALMFLAGCGNAYGTGAPSSSEAGAPADDTVTPPHRRTPSATPTDSGNTGSSASGGSSATSDGCASDSDCTGHDVCEARMCQAPNAPRSTDGACSIDTDCSGEQVCISGSCQLLPDGPNANTGGTSSMPDTSGTSGTSNDNGNAGTGNTTSTGNDGNVVMVTYVVEFRAKSDFTNFSFSYLSGKNFQGMTCQSGSGAVRSCTITVPADLNTKVVAKTGFSDAGSWMPGTDGQTGKCSAFYDVVVSRVNGASFQDVGFSLVSDGGSGCNFQIPANAPLIGNAPKSASGDWDNDGVLDNNDCEYMNPSVRPKLANESWDNEICGDGVDNDCSGADLVCGSNPTPGNNPSGNSNLVTETFIAFGSQYWANPLQLIAVTGNAGTVSCSKITSTDPEVGGNASYNAVRCDVQNVDRSREFEFQMLTGTQYATGYDANNVCMKNFRIYAYDWGSYPAGHFDSSSSTSTGNGKPMPTRYISGNAGCHVILPAQ